MIPRKRLVVLISGFGSNLQAILDASRAETLLADVAAVFSDRSAAFGLTRARDVGIPAIHRPFSPFEGLPEARRAYDAALADRVADYDPDLIVLAGWMRVLSCAFLDRFPGRVINLHPALPGCFPGAHAIERAFEAAQAGLIDCTGVTVHFAVEALDAGPVVASRRVPILPSDTLSSLKARVQVAERATLVPAIASLLG